MLYIIWLHQVYLIRFANSKEKPARKKVSKQKPQGVIQIDLLYALEFELFLKIVLLNSFLTSRL